MESIQPFQKCLRTAHFDAFLACKRFKIARMTVYTSKAHGCHPGAKNIENLRYQRDLKNGKIDIVHMALRHTYIVP